LNRSKEFGNRLAAERKRLGLSQSAFAEKCGVRIVSQHLYEKGDRAPNSDYLMAARDLGVRISFLFEVNPPDDRELAMLYKQLDFESRDEMGRLLEVEERTFKFIDLFKGFLAKR